MDSGVGGWEREERWRSAVVWQGKVRGRKRREREGDGLWEQGGTGRRWELCFEPPASSRSGSFSVVEGDPNHKNLFSNSVAVTFLVKGSIFGLFRFRSDFLGAARVCLHKQEEPIPRRCKLLTPSGVYWIACVEHASDARRREGGRQKRV